MIFDYIKAALFIILFIVVMYIAGSGFVNEKKSFSFKILIGYVIYNAMLGIGGIIIQFLNLSWYLFLGYEIIILILLVIFAFYKNKNLNVIWKQDFMNLFRNQWLLIIICLILLLMSVLDLPIHWLSNHLDDGYYLNRIATMPYIEKPFLTDPSTGLLSSFSLIRCINVFELEASGYVYLLQMSPVIFVRFALTFINYFLFIQCAYLLATTIVKSLNKKIDNKSIQFFLTPVLFFGFYYEWMLSTKILILQDGWQFSTAMWYGSSIVRVLGLFLCFVPIIQHKKIIWKDIIYFILLSICLFSKATQALPLMVLAGISYLIYMLLDLHKKWSICLSILIFALLFGLSFVLTANLGVQNHILNLLSMNKLSIVLIGCLIIFVASFLLKSKIIMKWNILLIIFFVLMVIPKLNTLFILTSVYDFVAARTLTMFWYTFMTTSFIYFFIILNKYLKAKNVMIISLIAGVGLCSIWSIKFRATNGIKNTASIIKNNSAIYPKYMEELSTRLQTLSENKNEKLTVLSPEFISVNGYSYNLCIMLRLHAPDITSISALIRYPAAETGVYKEFSIDDQELYYKYVKEPLKYIEDFKIILNKFNINAVIATNDCLDTLKTIGFNFEFEIPIDTNETTFLYIYTR